MIVRLRLEVWHFRLELLLIEEGVLSGLSFHNHGGMSLQGRVSSRWPLKVEVILADDANFRAGEERLTTVSQWHR
jgi:hypothetical protein